MIAIPRVTFRIDQRVNNVWREFKTYGAEFTYEYVERQYETFRDKNCHIEFRLVSIIENVDRSGKGLVCDD